MIRVDNDNLDMDGTVETILGDVAGVLYVLATEEVKALGGTFEKALENEITVIVKSILKAHKINEGENT